MWALGKSCALVPSDGGGSGKAKRKREDEDAKHVDNELVPQLEDRFLPIPHAAQVQSTLRNKLMPSIDPPCCAPSRRPATASKVTLLGTWGFTTGLPRSMNAADKNKCHNALGAKGNRHVFERGRRVMAVTLPPDFVNPGGIAEAISKLDGWPGYSETSIIYTTFVSSIATPKPESQSHVSITR